MTRREITAGCAWASRDAARAEAMQAERVEQDPVAQAELDQIQWEGQLPSWKGHLTPWVAAMDTQADGSRVSLYRAKAERASTEVVTFPGTES